MRKIMGLLIALCLVGLFLAPSADASISGGSGGGRWVLLTGTGGSEGNVTANCSIPTYLPNYTANNLSVAFSNADWVSLTYVVNVTINGTTYTTGAIAVATNSTATGYINISADALDLGSDLNVTVELLNDTYVQEDVFWGTVDMVDMFGHTSGMLVDLMVAMMTIFVVIGMFQMLMASTEDITREDED